jgi:DNA polymerase I
LNTQLQSDGAIISKYWLDESVKIIEDKGLKKGYDKDYTLMLFVHDELDWAVRKSKDDELVHIVGMANKEGALRTQKLLNFGMEIEVGDATERYKVGRNWAECH